MPFLPFFLGLAFGVAFYYWKQHQTHQELRQILILLSNGAEEIASLPMLSLVRREIARLNRQQQQLETELQSWKRVLEVAPLGYLLVDEENQLLWCNQKGLELLKIDRWQPGQVRLLLELVRSYELDQLIEETRRSQQIQTQEWVFYATNYQPQGIGVQSLPIKGYSFPLPKGQVGVFLENLQPLAQLSQSRERAFSDLTHELRTPLTSIRLVAETLQKRLQDPEKRWLDQMLKETNRLIDLVQDWLEISQLQENPIQNLHYESFDLHQLILSVWQTLKPLAQRKEVKLTYSGAEDIVIEADKSRLTQVFLNLLDNSIKHSPVSAMIEVEAEILRATDTPDLIDKSEANDYLNVSVIDAGEGFSETDLPYIFERLYRGDPSRTRQATTSQPQLPPSHGSGLGLAIVKQIIQAHGGSIQAKNHPQTGGAWLQFQLPLTSASPN